MDLPGLDVLVKEVPPGRIVLVEGGLDPSKSFLAEHVARRAADRGRKVLFVTSRERDTILDRMALRGDLPTGVDVVALERWEDLGLPRTGDRDLVVDAFSYFMIGRDGADVARSLRELRGYAHRSGCAALLTMERDMLPPETVHVIGHLTDGVLQFHMREGDDGLQRFLRIPKWTHGEVFTHNIYYDFDGRRLLIDTRRRVN